MENINKLTHHDNEIDRDAKISKKYNNKNNLYSHKLSDKWCLWGHLPHNTDWSINSYTKIITFDTIEEQIALFEIMPAILIKNCMLFLMKDGIYPTWEDPKNKQGGCFSYKIANKNVVDSWKNLSYSLIGNTLSDDQDFMNNITGITISPKKNFCIVKIWLTSCCYKDTKYINQISNLSNDDCIFKKHN